MGRPLNILVTGAGAPGFPGIVECLRWGRLNLNIITTDMQTDVVGFHIADKHFVVPSGSDPAFTDAINQIVRNEQIDIILPLCTFELLPLSKEAKNLEVLGAHVLVSKSEALLVALDKGQTYRSLRGSYVPTYRIVNSLSEFERAVHDLGYGSDNPVVMKPTFGRGMRGFRIIDLMGNLKGESFFECKPKATVVTLEEVTSILRHSFTQLLVMEYLPGEEYSVDTLSKNGHSYYAIVRKRVEIRRGISYIGEIMHMPELEELAINIVKQLGLDYCINLQFKADVNGKLKLLEINPRVSGSIVFCYLAGVNLPYFAVKLLLGEKIPKVKIRYGTKIFRCWTEIMRKKTWR